MTKIPKMIKMFVLKVSSSLEEKDKIKFELSNRSLAAPSLASNDKELSSLKNELTTLRQEYEKSQEDVKGLQTKLGETTVKWKMILEVINYHY